MVYLVLQRRQESSDSAGGADGAQPSNLKSVSLLYKKHTVFTTKRTLNYNV